MFLSNLGGKEEFKGIKRIQATNHVKFTMPGINQNRLSMQRNRKTQPIMRREKISHKIAQLIQLVDKDIKTIIIIVFHTTKNLQED